MSRRTVGQDKSLTSNIFGLYAEKLRQGCQNYSPLVRRYNLEKVFLLKSFPYFSFPEFDAQVSEMWQEISATLSEHHSTSPDENFNKIFCKTLCFRFSFRTIGEKQLDI